MTYYIIERTCCVDGNPFRESVGYITDPSNIPLINANGASALRQWMTDNAAALTAGTLDYCSYFTSNAISEVFYCCWETDSVEGMGLNEITDLSTVGVV